MEPADRLHAEFSVSRETLERLTLYVDLLHKWNPRINLVSKSTLAEAWTRHILDSAQMMAHLPKNARIWADLGSGGGFPGLVIAILALDQDQPLSLHLVESDQRKCAFLRAVIRETKVDATVHAERIETLAPLGADVVSARALAPLSSLLPYVLQHGRSGVTALFPKGRDAQAEIDEASKHWAFTCTRHQSITEEDAVILELGDIRDTRPVA